MLKDVPVRYSGGAVLPPAFVNPPVEYGLTKDVDLFARGRFWTVSYCGACGMPKPVNPAVFEYLLSYPFLCAACKDGCMGGSE